MSRIGKKAVAIPSGVNVTIDGQTVTVKGPKGQLAWTIADTTGFEETLELVGVGYRAAMKGTALSIQLGFSHDVDVEAPAGVTFAVPKQTEIKIAGADKQAVGEIAAKIRRIRPPEPYKGKGVRYAGEKVRRKEGKKK
jgi:large subunit ribosomal protein L6